MTEVAELVDAAVAKVRALPVKSAAPMRAVRAELSRQLKSAEPGEVIDAARLLKADGLGWFGWELIYAHKRTLKAIDRATVEELGQGMASWPETDGFGMILAGPAWLNGRLADTDIARWREATICGGGVPLSLRRRGSTTNRAAEAAMRRGRSRSSRYSLPTART